MTQSELNELIARIDEAILNLEYARHILQEQPNYIDELRKELDALA